VISPRLANLFLHYALDKWMAREFPHIPFERYADDVICHCKTEEDARALWRAIATALRPASWSILNRRGSSTARM
jgi:RNA-directed DNA polymerase